MPLIVQDSLPAIKPLEAEGLFVVNPERARTQDIRPLKIALVNLMPTKETTEIQFMRLLSNSSLQIDLTLLCMGSHHSKNTSDTYLRQFYKTLKQVEGTRFDGMIITGAPVEDMDFSEVDYWYEMKDLMAYTKRNVFSTMHVCWGAQAGLFYHYGINKHALPEKCFGVFPHTVNPDNDMLFKGANDTVFVPHSRHSGWKTNEIKNNKKLKVVLESSDAGVCVISAHHARQIFVAGHFEYDRDTLSKEYFRDLGQGKKIHMPENYFLNDDETKNPIMTWRGDANLLFSNWLNYVVYQRTPFDLHQLEPLED